MRTSSAIEHSNRPALRFSALLLICAGLVWDSFAQMQIGANFNPMGWGGWDLEKGNWGNLFRQNPNNGITGTAPVFKAVALSEVAAAYNGPMRWMEANMVNTALTNEYHASGRWEDRKPKSDYTQNMTLAYEYQIDFTNEVDRDYWVNVPCTADDDYVTQLATLIKSRLSPDHKVYIEWANETWNQAYPAFQSFHYVDSVAAQLNIPGSNQLMRCARYTTIRSLEVFALFEQAFSDQPHRIVKVLPGWLSMLEYTQTVFDTYNDPQYNPNGTLADAFAITGYCGIGGTNGATPGIYDTVRGYLENWGRPLWSAQRALCDANNVEMVAYESGSLCQNNAQAYVTNPEMYSWIYELYTALSDYFTVVNPFCHVGKWEYSKAWVGQPEEEANVYRALKDWTTNNPVGQISVTTNRAPLSSRNETTAVYSLTVVGANGTASLLNTTLSSGNLSHLFDLGGRHRAEGLKPGRTSSAEVPAGYYLLKTQGARR